MITYKKKDQEEVLVLKEGYADIENCRGENSDKVKVPYFIFPLLENTGLVRQAFSTRLGGVSEGQFATLNFSITMGDREENVIENYKRLCNAAGFSYERLILSQQTHTTNVEVITEDMVREGRTFEQMKPFHDVDGMITNVPCAVLATSYADCVPLYFLDPVKKAIGLSHSGRRGTVNRMGEVTIRKMQQVFGSDPKDILACVGPSICADCYEVGPEVYDEFAENFDAETVSRVLKKNDKGRYQLDLWKINRYILLNAGILPEHLAVTNVCTCCNHELLFSHRYTKGKRGNLNAFLSLI